MKRSISSRTNDVNYLQHYTVFRGLTYVLYGALWLYYLQQLLHHKHENTLCRDIEPTLRNVLLVIAWLKVVFTIFFLCIILTSFLLKPTLDAFVFIIACIVIVGVFVYQIQYIQFIEDTHLHTHQCHEIGQQKRNVVYVFSIVVFVFGLFLVAFGLSGRSMLQKLSNTDLHTTS